MAEHTNVPIMDIIITVLIVTINMRLIVMDIGDYYNDGLYQALKDNFKL